MKEKLLELNELTELLGFTDKRSVIKWCNENKLLVLTLGKKKYIALDLLNAIIESKLTSFFEANFENPEQIIESIKNDDKVQIAELLIAPIENKVKREFKQKNNTSKASKDFLNNINAA